MPDHDEVAWLVDRAAIHDLLARYAWAIDTWDAAAATGCFTPDGVLRRGDGEVVAEGADALLTFFSKGRSGGRFGTMGDGELLAVGHPIGSVLVEPAGEGRATARSACTATSLARHGSAEAVHLHGLRYEDELVRTAEGWRIARRTHHVDWVRTIG